MAHKTIFLKSGREGEPIQKEANADAALSPGMLLQYHTDGDVKKHAVAGGDAMAMFAIEDALQGNEIGDAYTANNRAQYVHCGPGDEVLGILAQGEAVAINDPLESNGAGLLRKHTAWVESSETTGTNYSRPIVGYALEALDLATSGDDDTAIKLVVA